jgi:hypothetical protein
MFGKKNIVIIQKTSKKHLTSILAIITSEWFIYKACCGTLCLDKGGEEDVHVDC